MCAHHWYRAALAAAVVLLSLTGCTEQTTSAEPAKDKPHKLHRVETAAVQAVLRPVRVERTGSLRARRTLQVTTQEEGRLLSLPWYEGDRVRAGQTLFTLDDTLLRAELKKALAQRRQAEVDLERVHGLQKDRLVSDDEVARARTALDVARAEVELLETRLGYTRASAPFDGLVTARLAEPGAALPRYSHLLTVADPASLVTEINVSELVLPALSVGLSARVRVDALGEDLHAGRISRIHPAVDPTTRQALVEVTLDQAPEGARPGQLCRVLLSSEPRPHKVVPFAALRRDGRGEFVYRLTDGRAQRLGVVSGEGNGENIAVTGELAEGDAVVVKGFYGLTDGKPVEAVQVTAGR